MQQTILTKLYPKFSGSQNTLYVEPGTYQIDAWKKINLKSNMNLVLAEGAVLQAIPNNKRGYDIVNVDHIENVTIQGGTIIGERSEHKKSSSTSSDEWGMGIGIYDSKNITVRDVTIRDCNGDGAYVGSRDEKASGAGSRYIYFENVKTENNRRNNMSIVCAKDVIIKGCSFKNANGTPPEYGIDIETDYASMPIERVTIQGCEFSGNGQFALGIINVAKDIRIVDSVLDGGFVNYAGGENIILSGTTITGEVFAREPISIGEKVIFRGSLEKEDKLIAEYIEGRDKVSVPITGFTLSAISGGKISKLTYGKMYRFEYKVRGKGDWNFKSTSTGRYPVVPKSDKASSYVATLVADINTSSTTFKFYQDAKRSGDFLEITEFRVYEVVQ
ncbi:MAG: right-handed parallel beta-helix repeat-containing protein [Lachnospiraceae bacterium]|nr:right-handed parallel beta-helix repeat-containing protein [Lachnospiraceae bacterium]